MPPGNSTPPEPPATRWLQLIIGVVCMVMIANLQYGWTLFVQPINEKYGWGRPAIQVAFSIFVITEAWLVPLEGWFVDRVYGTCVGNALKWFPDRRGLAAGITAAGFGVGSAFTIIPIQHIIHSSGYEAAFLWFGLGQGLVIIALAPFLRAAPSHDVPAGMETRSAPPAAAAVIQTRRS